MRKLNQSILGLILLLSLTLPVELLAQLQAVVYVDVSDQSNRKELVRKVDSVLAASQGEKLLYISNAGQPLIYQDANLGSKETAELKTLDPSLPNPYFDLDSLIGVSHSNNGLSNGVQLYFFLGYNQSFKGEKHLENIAEKYALSMGLVQEGEKASYQATAFINNDGNAASAKDAAAIKEEYSRIYQIRVY